MTGFANGEAHCAARAAQIDDDENGADLGAEDAGDGEASLREVAF